MSARSLSGQVVVITGAARGIGELLARRVAARGAKVALLGLEPERLAAVAAGCGPDAASWEVDVTDGARLAEVAAEVVARFGRVDVLVANAGIASGGSLLLADAAAFDRTIEVNLLGSVRTARAFLPALVDSHGYFLQVASAAALVPCVFLGAYCASKSGVEAFANSLRGELIPHGVRTGVGYLTWTDTDMVRGADEVASLRDLRAGMPGPLGRTYPLEPAIDRFVKGIERRAPRVYGQWWLPGVLAIRGFLPEGAARFGAKQVPAAEAAYRDDKPEARLAVGAGGAADTGTRPPS